MHIPTPGLVRRRFPLSAGRGKKITTVDHSPDWWTNRTCDDKHWPI